MGPIRLTWSRTMGVCRHAYSTPVVIGGFLAAAVISFVFALDRAEGGTLHLASVWTLSIAQWLPVLAAFLGMDVWSEERRSGRMAVLLSAPLPEREFVFGKFLGVWTVLMLTLLFCLTLCLVTLGVHAPVAVQDLAAGPFVAGLTVLAIQGALWCAVSVAASAVFRHSAAAAAMTVAVLVAIPRGIWSALMAWAPDGRTSYGILPLDAHVLDAVAGSVSSAMVVTYFALTVLALFVATKLVASFRMQGRGAFRLRMATGFALFLALTLAGLVIALAARLDIAVELPVGSSGVRFSSRTRGILADNREEISVTCFLARDDARFRSTTQFLRALARQANELGGARLIVRYVDPRWDLGAAERLVRLGVRPDSVVFERGHRHVTVPIGDVADERASATAIKSLVAPPSRRTIYWTQGHGEYGFADYGPRGMSDIARELARDGYSNKILRARESATVPRDCALVIVAGARDDFSRTELDSLEAYLRQGGRMLVLLGSSEGGGFPAKLSSWGIRPESVKASGLPTLTGTDVLVSDFSDHAIAGPLGGSRVIMDNPVALVPSAVAENGIGSDRIDFAPLASVQGVTLAAAVEQGADTGKDLEFHPMRIVVIGDATFAMNAPLEQRGNANRDFFLNAVAWLSGTDAIVSAGTGGTVFSSGMDRSARTRFLLDAGLMAPLAVFLLLLTAVWYGRRRA